MKELQNCHNLLCRSSAACHDFMLKYDHKITAALKADYIVIQEVYA